MQQESHTQLLHEAGAIVGGTAVYGQAHGHAQLQHLGDAGDAGGELHVADGAVGNAGTGLGQDAQLLVIEVDAVGIPHILADPAQALHIFQRTDTLALEHEVFLILGLTQVGVQAHAVLPGQNGTFAQQVGRDGEGGAGGQGYPVHGTIGGIVVLLDDPGGVLHDLLHGLHHAVRGQAAVLHTQVHAATAAVHADAQLIGGGKLGAQQVAGVGGEYIMMVKAGGAAVLHQLAHAGEGGETNHITVQIFPNFVESFEPVEQLHVLHLGKIAGKDLVEMMVGVHQAGIAEHMGAVDGAVGGGVQVRAELLNEAVLAQDVHLGQDPIAVITGDELGNILDQQGRHSLSSFNS